MTNERLSALIDLGFAAWARGQIAQAVGEWRRAAAMAPQGEAQRLIGLANTLYPELAGGAARTVGDELLGARTGWPLVGEPVVLPARDEDDSVPHAIQLDDMIALGGGGLRPAEPIAGGRGNPSRVPVPSEGAPSWARTPHGIQVLESAPLRAMTLAIPSHGHADGQVRHTTLPSAIPALLASGVNQMDVPGESSPEDATRPVEDTTRPVDDRTRPTDERRLAAGRSNVHMSPTVPRAPGQLIDAVARIQQAMAAGAAGMAVEIAEAALAEAEQDPSGTPKEMLDAARPVCERAFAAFVGSLTGVPALLVPKALLATQKLSPPGRRLAYQVNGTTPIDRILETTGTSRYEGLRALASLLRAGIIRIS